MDEVQNYRPIAITCHVSKIFERSIHEQVLSYLQIRNMLTPDQSAYLKEHSTSTSLHKVTDDWLQTMDDGDFTLICLLDIEKCFNSIDHSILLSKLKFYGIDEQEWFSNYLLDRKQYVLFNNVESSVETINIGIPQGSVLGPLLFLVYAND